MTMRTGLIRCLLGVGTLWLSGCHGGGFAISFDDSHHRSPRRHHYDEPSHVCVRGCNHHYYNGSRLVSLRGHRHRSGCGHHWSGTYWVVAASLAHRHRDAHVCSRSCHHHYYNGTSLVSLRNHRHGSGCGHSWSGTFWIRALGGSHGHQAHHVCSRGCHRHYHNGTNLVTISGHRHRDGCGHRWSGTYWVVASTRDHPRKKAHPHSGVRRVR